MIGYKAGQTLALYESKLALTILEAHKRGYGREITIKWVEALQTIFSDKTKRDYSKYKDYLYKKDPTLNLSGFNFKHLTNVDFVQLVYKLEPQDYKLCNCLERNIKDPALLLHEANFIHLQHFNKLFLEDAIKHMPHIKEPEILEESSLKYYASIYAKFRDAELFDKSIRGRIPEIKPLQNSSTHAGIVANKDVPSELKNYFRQPVNKAMFSCRADHNSQLVKAITKAGHPYVSGPSGTTCYLLANFGRILNLESNQLKILLSLYYAALTAEGHHALWEIAIVRLTKDICLAKLTQLHDIFFDKTINTIRLGNPMTDQLLTYSKREENAFLQLF